MNSDLNQSLGSTPGIQVIANEIVFGIEPFLSPYRAEFFQLPTE
jgi:hypothetical protein